MKIHQFYYDENSRTLYVEFSTKDDGLDYYRELELNYDDILFYSPDIIYEETIRDLDKNTLKGVINQYLMERDPPEQQTL